jgi:hypothetical protein
MHVSPAGNHFALHDLIRHRHLDATDAHRNFVMNCATDTREQIDRRTRRSICDAVGERLQQSLRPVESKLPGHLERLMDELRRRDAPTARMRSNQVSPGRMSLSGPN